MGFSFLKGNGDEHWYSGYIDGVLHRVMVDDGRAEIFGWVPEQNATQMGLTREEFYGLSKSASDRAKGVVYLGALPAERTAKPKPQSPAPVPQKQPKFPDKDKRRR